MNEGKRQAYSTNLIQLLIKHVGASLRARALLGISRRYPEEDEDLSPDEEMETTKNGMGTFIFTALEGRGRPGLGGQMRGLPHKDRLLGARIVVNRSSSHLKKKITTA
ncbi:hypothetical protein ACJX0J_000803 (mitochondrion) [Zea mays]